MTSTFLKATLTTALATTALIAGTANAKIETGSTVADMTVTDSNGTTHNLSDFAGKTVVLEWTNHGCPYVKKHYNTAFNNGNMQTLQKDARADGVVWLSVISSAPGKQGYVSGDQANNLTAARSADPMAVVLDPSGDAGRTFAAKTTPHMYVINADQKLVYQGAIDDNRSSSPKTIEGATNYVTAALASVKAGETVANSDTAPYGCSVKY